MPTLFTKALETLVAEDAQAITGWPESITAEFKQDLPTKDGRLDAWHAGGKVGDFARDKLLREIVALANTEGGHLVLGIEEERSASPRVAGSIKPIPRCVALAERLSQMAQHIDPPVPLLLVQGVPIEGDAGVVLFRVPRSRSAPHRAPDKECYVRRGTESVPISMREIQNMAIAGTRGADWIANRRRSFSGEFQMLMQTARKQSVALAGFRVSFIPSSFPLSLERLYEHPHQFQCKRTFSLDIGSGPFDVVLPKVPDRPRPMVRGLRLVHDDSVSPAYIELHSDGCCSLTYTVLERANSHRLYLAWFAAGILNGVDAIDFLRTKALQPELEYSVDIEIGGSEPGQPIPLHAWGTGFDDGLGELRPPIQLPEVSYGPKSERAALLGTLLTDLRDAAGAHLTDPISFSSAF